MDLRSGTTIAGQLIWHAGNMGSGSGLSADTVRGYAPDTSVTANTLILRDASGNATANIFTTTTVRGVNVGVLDAGTVYYTTLVSNSSTDLTADRTLTLDLNNANRVLALYATTQIGHATNTGAVAIYSSGTGATGIIGPSGGTATLTAGTMAIQGAGTSLSQFGSSSTTSAQLASLISDKTGSGAAVFGTTPTFTTSIIDPLVIGGTTTTSSLSLRSTSGVGTTGADIIFQVGNNGAAEAMRILNSGYVGIGENAPGTHLVIKATNPNALQLYRTSSNNCHIQYQNTSYTTFAGLPGTGGFGVGPNIDLANATTWMTITPAAGNMGVGEVAPAEKLHVNGNIRVDDTSGNDGFKMAFDSTTKTLNFIYVGA